MEDTISHMESILREFKRESPNPGDLTVKNVGEYQIFPEDLGGQVIDYIVTYMENRKCPHALALVVAQRILERITASFFKRIQFDNEDSEKFPTANNLYLEATYQLKSVCSDLLEESNLEETISSVGPFPYKASAFATRNKRRKMEDKHVVYPNLNYVLNIQGAPLHSYYAVFDGHSGVEAANFASAQLHMNIAKHPCFLLDTVTAIREAYKITDECFLKRCAKENIKSGCTVLCALVRENNVYLSWLGDSQAILVKQGKATILTSSHKPEREDERQRIENLGGHITFSGVLRVNGVLAVTRALGDPDHKPFVSNEPEISVITLDGSEDFLILGCDGLWDGMSSEDVSTSLYHNILEASLEEVLDTIAAKLVHQSKVQGSEDNITAVVVLLRDLEAIKEDAKKFYCPSPKPQVDLLQREIFTINTDTCTTINGSNTLVKPSVLELSFTSTKKLKNTANVLNSTGLGKSTYHFDETDPVLLFPTSPTDPDPIIVDGACGISIPQQNSSYFAPETTALSELPTPPIDDILASQQFENFSRSKQQSISISKVEQGEYSCFQGSGDTLNNIADKSHSHPVEAPSQFATVSSNFDMLSTSETENTSNVTNSIEAITPDEAIGVASCVVSNAIESAVKRLSSPEMSEENSLQSPIKLNPYAEPFVMKSFCVEDPLPNLCTQNEKTVEQVCLDVDDVNNLQNLVNNISENIEEKVNSTDEYQNITSETKNDVEIETFETICTESLQINAASTIVKDSVNLHLLESETKNIPSSEIIPNENATSDVKGSTIKLENETHKFTDYIIHDASLNSNDKLISSDDSVHDLKDLKRNYEDLDGAISAKKKDHLDCDPNEQDMLSSHSKITSEDSCQSTFQISDLVSDNKSTSEKLSVLTLLDLKQETEEPDAPLLLKNITHESVEISVQTGPNTTEAMLPSSHVSELPVETVAVDLQSVPVGVPEAEGVTEDVDSDSEKDGGWSYMKGSNDTNVKSKEDEQQILKKNLETKSEIIFKTKREISKPVVESKVKKNTVLNEKNKLQLAGRKIDVKDTKEKNKIIKPTTLVTVAKTNNEKGSTRVVSTVARSQKETIATTSKSTATVTNKAPKLAASKNVGTVGAKLPNSGTSAKNVAPTKVSSSTMRPKLAVTMQGTKTSHPASASTLPRGQPSNQSNRVNAAPVRNVFSRPATSVPSKVSVAAKAMPSSRPVSSEMKPKPQSLLKKTTLPTVKKADVKETKDTVNKQISADKNRALGTLKTETTSRIISNRRTNVASNLRSTVSRTTTSASKKEILKKDVPKIPASKAVAKSALSSKLTKNLVHEKPAIPKEAQGEIINVQEMERNATEITPLSSEEKFILETNTKETIKETQQISPETVQISYANGSIEDVKTTEKSSSAEDFTSENP